MKVEKDYAEFLKLLNEFNVKYLIVGAYAVTFYSKPRNTGDVDIFIKNDKSNADKIIKMLTKFGFVGLNITRDDLVKDDVIIQLGVAPVRIDLMTTISGIGFDEAYNTKVAGKLGSIETNFISYEMLIKNKKESGRKKDLADLELLLKFRKSKKDKG